MKYDVLTLQIFQSSLELIKATSFDEQFGICDCIFYACEQYPKMYDLDYDLVRWMQEEYMPHKAIGEFWWPVFRDNESMNNDELIQSKADRIAFLERIIENLMCGE